MESSTVPRLAKISLLFLVTLTMSAPASAEQIHI
jgi:hypothetical protein